MFKKSVLAVIASIFMATAVYAQHPGFGMDNSYGQRGRQYSHQQTNTLESLNLTDNQKLQLSIIKADKKRKLIRLKADISIIKVSKKQATRKRDFDEKVVKKLIEKTLEVRRKMEMVKFDSLLKTRKLLTDKQWEKYCQLQNQPKRPSMGRGGFGGRHQRGFQQKSMDY